MSPKPPADIANIRHQLLTVYGRKPVLEALQDTSLQLFRLHLARSNRDGGIMDEIQQCAQQRSIEVVTHTREELSRISRNGQQDQGVALDIMLPCMNSLAHFLRDHTAQPLRLILLDNITTPANVGMIIRSVCASNLHGVIIPEKGCATLDSLVIKASAGTLFRAPVLRTRDLADALQLLSEHAITVCSLDSHAAASLFDTALPARCVFVLGNENQGVSAAVHAASALQVRIPLQRGVESLNVAACATLLAFSSELRSNQQG